MGYKLLLEILNYEEEKENFSKKEQEEIERDLKNKTKSAFKKIGKKIITSIDYINDH